MSIYYQDDHVTLYHGDAREVMANMADQSVTAGSLTRHTPNERIVRRVRTRTKRTVAM